MTLRSYGNVKQENPRLSFCWPIQGSPARAFSCRRRLVQPAVSSRDSASVQLCNVLVGPTPVPSIRPRWMLHEATSENMLPHCAEPRRIHHLLAISELSEFGQLRCFCVVRSQMMGSEAVEFSAMSFVPTARRQFLSLVLCAELRAALDRDRDHNLPFDLRHLVQTNSGECPEGLCYVATS